MGTAAGIFNNNAHITYERENKKLQSSKKKSRAGDFLLFFSLWFAKC